MGKPVNIASTSHAQQAELAALLGGPRSAVSVQASDEKIASLNADVEELTAQLAAEQELRGEAETALNAEREAHAKTQAALAAATSASTGE